jgi:hypothetical protein
MKIWPVAPPDTEWGVSLKSVLITNDKVRRQMLLAAYAASEETREGAITFPPSTAGILNHDRSVSAKTQRGKKRGQDLLG